MPYLDSLDIANRALQHCEQTQILTPTEDSKNNLEATFTYDKVRRAELRRNTWVFATRRVALRAVDTTTMILQPALYDATVIYLPGAIVSDANGQLWLSMTESNLGNTPGGNNNTWEAYFGPLTVTPYTTAVAYYAGELVYVAGTPVGTYTIYMSLVTGNTDVPNTATVWSATTQYNGEDTVSYGGFQWHSLIELNLNVTPTAGPAAWASTTTYSAGNTVTGSNAHVYASVGNGNVGNDPVLDLAGTYWTDQGTITAWAKTPTVGVSATSWRLINATMKHFKVAYPLGSGPSSNSFTRNIFRLPAGYLIAAPQDPKAGAVSIFGAPTGLLYNDWLYEGKFITSMSPQVILLRFVADTTKVIDFDDMFCEGLALRLALGLSPTLQNDGAKLQRIAGEYQKMMSEARIKNAIEKGAEQPPEDDWISTRL